MFLVDADGHEIDLASGTAQAELWMLGKLARKGLVDIEPGKTSPAYWINRHGLVELGARIH